MYVIKRDGTQDLFDKQKIIDAINKAFVEVDGILYETDTAEDIAQEIEDLAKQSKNAITVEAIQNCVEDLLMVSERRDVARAYIRFRYKREVARERKADFMDAIAEKLEARNVKNQNANVDEYSFGGRKGEASDVMTKQYALENCISNMARNNHLNNRIYIHDLSAYATGEHNCLTVPFDDLLAKGFETRQTDVRTAGSVNTAFQLVAVIFQLQSLQQFGGVAASHLDWTMVPYVRRSFWKWYKDGLEDIEELSPEEIKRETSLAVPVTEVSITDDFAFSYNRAYRFAMKQTEREIHQAVEGLYHNLK